MIISLQIDHKLNYECHNTSQSTIANIKKKLLKAPAVTNKKTPKFKRTRDKLYSPGQPITV